VETPCLTSPAYRTASGGEILFKMDALQPSGSFKMRGVGRLCQYEVEHGAQAIVCASGGNAGYAAAVSGRRLGVPVRIVVPETTSSEAVRAIEAEGAAVEVHGASFDAADVRARAIAGASGAAYVHPFDHPLLWEGHASLIDEVVESGERFDVVVLSVGGGGLLLGVLEGLRRNGLDDVAVVAVETMGAASLHASLEANELVVLPEVSSIATSLGARQVAPEAFLQGRAWPVQSVRVTDAEALAACRLFARAFRILVEPACGAALAALTVHPELFAPFERPLVEVCGGIGVSIERLAAWERDHG
jgi:L-serine/L-threonine ammonia-lyase